MAVGSQLDAVLDPPPLSLGPVCRCPLFGTFDDAETAPIGQRCQGSWRAVGRVLVPGGVVAGWSSCLARAPLRTTHRSCTKASAGRGVLPIPLAYHGWVQNLPTAGRPPRATRRLASRSA